MFPDLRFAQEDSVLVNAYLNSLPNKVYYGRDLSDNKIWNCYDKINFTTAKKVDESSDTMVNYHLSRSALKENITNYYYYIPSVEDSSREIIFTGINGNDQKTRHNGKPYPPTLEEAEIQAASIDMFSEDLSRYQYLYFFDNAIELEAIGWLAMETGYISGLIRLIGKQGSLGEKNLKIIALSSLGACLTFMAADMIDAKIRQRKSLKIRRELLERIHQNNQRK